MPGLGLDVPTRPAAIAALDDAALRALLLEPALPDPAQAAILADHVWVEAYLGGAWTALDPSFHDTVAGELVATPLAGGRTAAIPESLRHHVVVRLVPESYEPAWGQPPTAGPAAIELTRGAGDFVGRQVTSWQRNDRVTSSGFFFFTQSSTYVPMLEISDLERLGTPEQLEGEEVTEFTSNFGGGLANSYATALFAQVELLAPGQLAGQGQLLQRPAADRLGFAARAGLPYSSDELDLGQPLIDPTDVTTLTIGSAPLPARLARSAQLVLGSLIAEAQAALPVMEATPQADLTDEQRELVRSFSGQLSGTLALLHRVNLGERTRLLSQGLLERPFAHAPNVVASAFHVTQDGAAHHRFDLLREELDAVGPPGQLLTQRRTFRGAYGWAATLLESAVLETLGAGVANSAARILDQAEISGIPVLFLSGQLGRDIILDGGVALPHEAALRLFAALDQGKSAFVPAEPVMIDGVPRTGWLEVAPDGSLLGRLEDGSGGAALEYSAFLIGLACDIAGRAGNDNIQCPPSAMGFCIKMIQATGTLFGLLSGAFSAVDACTGGDLGVCRKLQTDFAPLARTITSQSFGHNGSPPFEQCTVPFALFATTVNAMDLDQHNAVRVLACGNCQPMPYGPWEVVETLVNGYCAATQSVSRANNAVIAAMADPLLPGLPGGVMDAEPSDPSDRTTATGSVDVVATLPPDDLSGVVDAAHLRLSGALAIDWTPVAPQTLLTRGLAADPVTVSTDGGAPAIGAAAWTGHDLPVRLSGATSASLTGSGSLDLYAGALGSGVAVAAGFGNALALGDDGGYALTLAGAGLGLELDTADAPGRFSSGLGELSIAGLPVPPGLHAITTASASTRGRFAGPLGASAATIAFTAGTLSFTGATGALSGAAGAVALSDGLGLSAASGTISVAPDGTGVDWLTVQLTGVERLVLMPVPATLSGAGPFVVDLGVESSVAGNVSLTAIVPRGFSATFDGSRLTVTPRPGATDGVYELRLTASAPGLSAAAVVPLTLGAPAAPEVRLAVVDDPRFSVETGLRSSARLLEVTHVGPLDGSYSVAVTVDDPRLVGSLSATSAVLRPYETRRLGLSLGLADPAAPWPAPGTPYSVTLTATGSASATLVLNETVAALPSLSLLMDPAELYLAPGAVASARVVARATGNQAVTPDLRLSTTPGITAALDLAARPLQPGDEDSIRLELTVPAGTPVPSAQEVIVSLRPTAFELSRGLPPQEIVLRIAVVPPGTELLTAVADRALLGPGELAGALFGVRTESIRAAVACDPARVQALQDSLAVLRVALGVGPATAAAIAELDAASARLTAEGCAAAQDPSLFSALATSLDAATRGPNLVAALTLPASVLNGTRLDVTGEIRNGGDADAPASDAQLLLRRGAEAAQILGNVAIPALAPGEAAPVSLQWDTTAALGSYVISLRADVGGVVAELDEANQLDRVIEILPRLPGATSRRSSPARRCWWPAWRSRTCTRPSSPIRRATRSSSTPRSVRGLRLAGGQLVGELPRVGSHEVVLVAVDRYGASASQQFTIVATDAIANSQPLIASLASPHRGGGRALQLPGGRHRRRRRSAPGEPGPGPRRRDARPERLDSGGPLHARRGGARSRLAGPGRHRRQGRRGDPALPRGGPGGAARPDLAVVAVELTQVADAGRQRGGTVRVGIANLGDQPAPATEVTVFEGRDGVRGLDPADGPLGTTAVAPLSPGSGPTWTWRSPAPSPSRARSPGPSPTPPPWWRRPTRRTTSASTARPRTAPSPTWASCRSTPRCSRRWCSSRPRGRSRSSSSTLPRCRLRRRGSCRRSPRRWCRWSSPTQAGATCSSTS